jgi:hypothetical protein
MHSGISEPDITKAATTLGISIIPITNKQTNLKNDQTNAHVIMKKYFEQFNSCVLGKSKRWDLTSDS